MACINCGATTLTFYSEDRINKATEAWNNRKPVEDVLERLEKKIQPLHNVNWNAAMEEAIEIIKGELL